MTGWPAGGLVRGRRRDLFAVDGREVSLAVVNLGAADTTDLARRAESRHKCPGAAERPHLAGLGAPCAFPWAHLRGSSARPGGGAARAASSRPTGAGGGAGRQCADSAARCQSWHKSASGQPGARISHHGAPARLPLVTLRPAGRPAASS